MNRASRLRSDERTARMRFRDVVAVAMNAGESRRKARTIKVFDKAVAAACVLATLIPVALAIYTGVKVPNPLAWLFLAAAVVGPFLVLAICLPLKYCSLHAIGFRCASCNQLPWPHEVRFVLAYSICPRCWKPFVTDPPRDLLQAGVERAWDFHR